jgi:hypothetical protein
MSENQTPKTNPVQGKGNEERFTFEKCPSRQE